MKYLIIGAGGTGGCIGAYLAKSGNDVTFIARGKHLEAIKEKGITIERARDSFTVKTGVSTAEDYNGRPDVVFVCVKYYSLESILPLLKRACGSETVVILILNVFGTGAVLQESLPEVTVLDGCIYIYSFIKEAGVISLPSENLIFRINFGYRKGQEKTNEKKVCQIKKELKEAGVETYFEPEIEKVALLKFSLISPMGAALVYYDARVGDIRKKEGAVRDTYMQLTNEIRDLGRAMGIDLGDGLAEKNLNIGSSMPNDSTTSLHRDVLKGHASETEGLIHRVVSLGEKYGLDLPIYRKISGWAKEKGIK